MKSIHKALERINNRLNDFEKRLSNLEAKTKNKLDSSSSTDPKIITRIKLMKQTGNRLEAIKRELESFLN